MAEIIDTPLTRQKKKYDAEIAVLTGEIDDLKLDAARVRGVNELLKFELLSLEGLINDMQKTNLKMLEHILTLKNGLPE